jgi:NAD(P)-dependent dehydrogenase (short-subunit alcohol dehydrogenase family)
VIVGKLDGKVAVITGGSSGMALAGAKLFVDEGAHVFISGRRQEALDEAVKLIGRNVTGVQADSTDLDDLDRLFDAVRREKGAVDVLWTSAGTGEERKLGEITEQHFDATFGLNARGTLFTVQKALPLFRDGGSIILNASTAASKGTPAFSIYSATKAAVRNFARSWILDLADRHIRVNAISPGPIATPGLEGLAETEERARQFKTSMAAGIPLGRLGVPDEVAKAVVFLASDDSSFVNGVELFVDGGFAQI